MTLLAGGCISNPELEATCGNLRVCRSLNTIRIVISSSVRLIFIEFFFLDSGHENIGYQ